ncbi:hypothetical protein LSH36_257g02059 [Paralvinella palmiformis]|uniref:RING-type domain-containing protein n=1 Tax=Paralvinella palmiformis TaxID=53620 RepID=A0AAD9JKB2_9ANNE|nr:hypothetical protein LSH36_257g02059 [Paralvinella palmiformis]
MNTSEELRAMVSCEICLEELKNRSTRALSCLHVFCDNCITTLLDITKIANGGDCGVVNCPICGVEANIPGADVKGLHLFFSFYQDGKRHQTKTAKTQHMLYL